MLGIVSKFHAWQRKIELWVLNSNVLLLVCFAFRQSLLFYKVKVRCFFCGPALGKVGAFDDLLSANIP